MVCGQEDDLGRIRFALHEEIIAPVLLIDCGIDDSAVILPVQHLRLRKAPEILCPAVIDSLGAIAVGAVGGRPVQHIVPLLPVADDVRRPEASEVLVS